MPRKTHFHLFLSQCFSEIPGKTLKQSKIARQPKTVLKRLQSVFHLQMPPAYYCCLQSISFVYSQGPVILWRNITRTHTHIIIIIATLWATPTDLAEVLELVLDVRCLSDKSIVIMSVIRKLFTGNTAIPPFLQIIHYHFTGSWDFTGNLTACFISNSFYLKTYKAKLLYLLVLDIQN